MGKSRVKGIVVEIGGDTVGLDKALQGTNKQIGNTQSKLKDVERLLKLDPKNTVLLEQKQKLLAQAIQETKEKQEALNQAHEQVKASMKNYDQWKAAYDPIKSQIDDTSKKLKDLKKQQQEMEDCGEIETDGYKQLTEEIQNASKELKDLKKQAKEVSDHFGNPADPEQLDSLQREIIETELQLKSLGDEAHKTENRLNGVEEEARDVADAMDDAGQKTSAFGDVLKAEAIVAGAERITEALKEVAEGTKDYRKIMGSLEVSSEAASYTGEETYAAYKKLQGVLADEQSAATTVANLQALGLGQEELLDLIDEVIGGWARYGDSIPIDGLAESINETVKSGKVTGAFADILNWGAAEGEDYGQKLIDLTKLQEAYDAAVEKGQPIAKNRIWLFQQMTGIGDVWDESVEKMEESEEKELAKLKAMIEAIEEWNATVSGATTAEDKFNIALQQHATEEERLLLVMQTLQDQGLAAVGEKWRENNASMVEANETSADLQEQLAELAEVVEPMMTRVTEAVIEFLKWFNDLDGETQNFIIKTVALVAALGPVIGAIAGTSVVTRLLSKTELPGLGTALGKISGVHLPSLQGAFSSVFGFIAANPVVLLIGAIVGLVALVATKSEECIEILNMVDNFLQAVFAVDWTEIFGPVLGGAMNDFFALLKEVWDGVRLMLEGIIDFIAGVFSGDWERAWEGVRKIFTGIFDSLEGLLKTPINGVIKMINKAIDGINWLIDGVNRIPGVSIDTIGQIPMLANGGEVFRGSAIVGDAGPELLTVLPDRTVVQPLTNNYNSTVRNMGSPTINVYGAPGQDVRELAEAVAEEMQYLYESEEAAIR